MSVPTKTALPSSPPRRPALRWDIVEEHLEEAAFLWTQWEQALDSHEHVLAEVVGGEEWRLRAHLEGLDIAGPAAAKRLLLPVLESEERGLLCAAAHVLLASREPGAAQAVWGRLVDGPEDAGRALLRAAALSERVGVDRELLAVMSRLKPGLRPAVLEALGARGAKVTGALRDLTVEDGPERWAAALHIAPFAERSVAGAWIQKGLHGEGGVLDAAVRTGLVLGMRSAGLRCRQLAEAGAPEAGLSLLALAVGGEPADLQCVVRALDAPNLRDAAVWALGFSGQPVAAEAVLRVLRETGGWLAADAFAAITGMPLEVGATGPEAKESDGLDEDEEESLASSGALLPPAGPPGTWDGLAVEAWWKHERTRFESGRRFLRGHPWTPEAALTGLLHEPMHRRPVLAWELSVRTGGAFWLNTRAWAWRQVRMLAALRPQALAAVPRSFPSFITR